MLQGLRSAVARQRKLLVLFLITIFLPAISLSIFGIIALRNEKFRLENQIGNELQLIANNIKSGIEANFTEMEEKLRNLSINPSLRQKDYPAVKEILTGFFSNDSLADIIFLKYPDEEIVFPMFHLPSSDNERRSAIGYTTPLLQKIKDAEDAEFIRNDYLNAVSLYKDAFLGSENNTIKARMLNFSARNLMKAGKYKTAAEIYSRISNEYSDERTESGLPLDLYADLQKSECLYMLGDKQSAAVNDMDILEGINSNKWNLNENQFKNYSSIVIERLSPLLSNKSEIFSEYNQRFDKLMKQLHDQAAQWETIINIKSFIAPELPGYFQNGSPSNIRFTKRINNEDYFIQSIEIHSSNQRDMSVILGIKLNNQYFKNTVLTNVIRESQPLRGTAIFISTLSGDPIIGTRNKDPEAVISTSLFDNNFPPWQMELSYSRQGGLKELSLFSNFYFWTIITLIIILVFGSALIVRLVIREMEVLKIKSDFVSSVSHEFKTPLTSMKALTERLEKGKVTEPAKMNQYISIISHDIDRLIRLVSNILSFSKIEEGRKILEKEETDIASWLRQTINNFRKENSVYTLTINVHIDNDLPKVLIDRDTMIETINNLLDNAFKFSPGDKIVEVSAEDNSKSVIIKIKDKGMGIDEHERERIFDKFYRGENAVKNSIKGTGLGLSLVKYNVEAHGGLIDIVNEPGWSTVFRIILPLGC